VSGDARHGLRRGFEIDRDATSSQGMSPQLIDATLYDAFWTTSARDPVHEDQSGPRRDGVKREQPATSSQINCMPCAFSDVVYFAQFALPPRTNDSCPSQPVVGGFSCQ
jgi:hypothetical protein